MVQYVIVLHRTYCAWQLSLIWEFFMKIPILGEKPDLFLLLLVLKQISSFHSVFCRSYCSHENIVKSQGKFCRGRIIAGVGWWNYSNCINGAGACLGQTLLKMEHNKECVKWMVKFVQNWNLTPSPPYK